MFREWSRCEAEDYHGPDVVSYSEGHVDRGVRDGGEGRCEVKGGGGRHGRGVGRALRMRVESVRENGAELKEFGLFLILRVC